MGGSCSSTPIPMPCISGPWSPQTTESGSSGPESPSHRGDCPPDRRLSCSTYQTDLELWPIYESPDPIQDERHLAYDGKGRNVRLSVISKLVGTDVMANWTEQSSHPLAKVSSSVIILAQVAQSLEFYANSRAE